MDNKILVLIISALATFLIGFGGKAFLEMPDILLIFSTAMHLLVFGKLNLQILLMLQK